MLENKEFEFNKKYYKQVIGCAIRACPSPQISDIRMYEITKDIIAQYQYRHKIIFHGRFRDDGDITEATQLLILLMTTTHYLSSLMFRTITRVSNTPYKARLLYFWDIADCTRNIYNW